jgi:hypothetical protein
MAYNVSATPLRRILPQFLAIIVQFYEGGSCDNCCGDRRPFSAELKQFLKITGLGDGEMTSCGYGAGLVQTSCIVYAMSARF